MPRRQAEVEQGCNLHRLQQAYGVQREAFVIAEFSEVIFTPGEQFLGRPLAVGKIGKVGPAVGQVGGRLPRFALQHGERNSLVSDDDAETRVRQVGSSEADDFHGVFLYCFWTGLVLYFDAFRICNQVDGIEALAASWYPCTGNIHLDNLERRTWIPLDFRWIV